MPPVFFFTFAFGSAALVDFTAGNIAVFEQLVLWLAFAALLARRRWTFALLVVLAAQCKLTPVFFLGTSARRSTSDRSGDRSSAAAR